MHEALPGGVTKIDGLTPVQLRGAGNAGNAVTRIASNLLKSAVFNRRNPKDAGSKKEALPALPALPQAMLNLNRSSKTVTRRHFKA